MDVERKDSDKRLLQEIKSNDERAFRVLFDRYYGKLCDYALFYLRNATIAKEIVSDVFLRTWHRRMMLDAETTTLKAYLFTAVRNGALNHLRDARSVHVSLDDKEVAKIQSSSSAEGDMLYAEFEKMITDAIDSMPDRQAEVFRLSRFYNLTYQQIAETLSISPHTVQEHMINALKHLRRTMRDQALLGSRYE
jgi:RNA polymerase sigma-70 factor (family 1)